MLKRAYSILNVKSLEDSGEERIIKGIASTPSMDRMGDEVEPLGAIFKTPMPLLLHHDHRLPVGKVEFAKATKDGIPFEARIAKIDEAGVLKDRTDEAWQSVKEGLIPAVSIGFMPIEYAQTKTGFKFSKWEWHELSLVTVPANSEATILAVKTLDDKHLSALAQQKVSKGGVKFKVGDSTSNNQSKSEEIKMKKYADQIAQIKAKLASNLARMDDMQSKSLESGETFSAEEKEEFSTLQSEVGELEEQVKGLEFLQSKATAPETVEVKGGGAAAASASRTPGQKAVAAAGGAPASRVSFSPATVKDNSQKGLNFVKAVKCIAQAKGNDRDAMYIAQERFGSDNQHILDTVNLLTKASVDVASNAVPAYAGHLVPASVVSEFLEYQEPLSIIGQLNLRQVPFGEAWVESNGGGQAYWVGEGQRKPATEFSLRRDEMKKFKVAALAVATMENIQDSSPKSDLWLRDELTRVLNRELDLAFINPTNAGSSTRPASVTYGVTPIASTGNIYNDFKAALTAFKTQTKGRGRPAILMDSTSFEDAMWAVNSVTGVALFPELSSIGTIKGTKVVVSDYMAELADSTGRILAVVNEDDIVLGYSPAAPDLIVKASDQASVVLDDDPSATTAPVSLWQNNLYGVLVERRIDWRKRRAQPAVVVVNGINW